MSLIKFFFKYWQGIDGNRPKGLFILCLVLICLSGLGNTYLLALVSQLFDGTQGGPNAAGLFLAACLAVPALRYAAEITTMKLMLRATEDLQMILFKQVLSAPLRVLEKIGGARMMAMLTEDMRIAGESLTSVIMLGLHGTIVLCCLGYLAMLSPWVAGGVFLVIVIGFSAYLVIANRAWVYLSLAREDRNRLYRGFEAVTYGNKELKLHYKRRESFYQKTLSTIAERLRTNDVRGNSLNAFAGGFTTGIYFLMIAGLLFLAPRYGVLQGEDLRAASLVILFMINPIASTVAWIDIIGVGNISVKNLEAHGLSLVSEEHILPIDKPYQPRTWQNFALDGVTFEYKDGDMDHPFRVGPIDLSFTAGEVIFIQGGNGSGKTTLAKLILGLYRPDAGRILVDGQPVSDDEVDDYRQMFSVVFLDFLLLEGLMGADQSDVDKRATGYLKRLEIDHKVRVEDGRFTTTELSQGQRKRLALLNAYLEDRPIYIFDEWASDQDPVFRKVFYHEILPELKAMGKTVIAITHDVHYSDVADRIIKLDYGQVEYDTKDTPAARS